MLTEPHDRRNFLRAAAAAGLVLTMSDLDEMSDALVRARRRVAGGAPQDFEVLDAEQAATVAAIAARIIPSDDGLPGATEAGVVHYIDRALATFSAGQKPAYTEGIADLDRRVSRAHGSGSRFASVTTQQQDEVLRSIERTPFFGMVRFDTIVGMWALPTYGGNRDFSGWQAIGMEHQPLFRAPFGWYDAQVTGEGG
jgi:gluconate 2-dehydrogenase gamma chain